MQTEERNSHTIEDDERAPSMARNQVRIHKLMQTYFSTDHLVEDEQASSCTTGDAIAVTVKPSRSIS